MPLSITIANPMPSAVLPPSFTVSGTYTNFTYERDRVKDRNLHLRMTTVSISVTVSKNGMNYGPFLGLANGNNWSAQVNNIPAGNGYTVTATISDTVDMASHSIETVDVQAAPGIVILTVTPPPNPLADAASGVYQIEGKYEEAGANRVFCCPYTILVDLKTENTPEGKHYKVKYKFGSPQDAYPGTLDPATKTFVIKDVRVNDGEFVMVFLRGRRNHQNSSELF